MSKDVAVIVIGVALLALVWVGWEQFSSARGVFDNQIACTTDAKICPDGSAVGRVGPHCKFAQCPDG